MKLWQKGFLINKDIEKFTIDEDNSMDLLLAPYDVIGSIAHAIMLKKTGLISADEWNQIDKALKEIFILTQHNGFEIPPGVEDIHSQVEILLTEKTGDPGKKIHTGRSRNDQVLLDIRLFVRDEIIRIAEQTGNFSRLLIEMSEKNKDNFMPGYTHFQAAMPSTFGMWFGAYGECISDDLEMLKSTFDILNRNPLGSAAGYGSSFPVDRALTSELLGFSSLNINSIAAQMGRGRTERILTAAVSQIADTIARFAGEICLYMGQDFGFFSFPDELTTGSSIMPHKKNPDVLELVRGKCNQIKSLPNEMMMITTNLPSGYHRDYQLMKSRLIWGLNTLHHCIVMTQLMVENMKVNTSLKNQEKYKYLYSVDLINEYVKKGTPFRDAYKIVSELIRSGKFEIPEKGNYTHEGSIGNLMNDKILTNIENSLNYFSEKANYIEGKFESLTGYQD